MDRLRRLPSGAPPNADVAAGGADLNRLALRTAGVLAIAGVYFAAAELGLSLALVAKQVSPVWPPTGLALAAMLLFGQWVWPGIMLGAFAANALADEPWTTALGIATGNTLEAVVGAWLLRAVDFRTTLERVRDVAALIFLAAGVSTTVSATAGVISLCLGGVHSWASFGSLWSVWWLGDAMGDLVVAPLMLTWSVRTHRLTAARLAEAATLSVGLVATGLAIFSLPEATDIGERSSKYAVFPFVIWAALRFGQQGATAVTAAASGMAVWSTLRGLISLGAGSVHERLLLLQIFMAVVAVTALILGAALAERRRDVEALRRGEVAMRQSEARKSAVLESSLDAIVTIDHEGRVVEFNPATEKLFGYAAADLAGRNVKLLMPEPYHGEHDGYLAAYLQTGQAKIIGIGREVVGRRKDGSTFPMELAVSEFQLGDRRFFTGIVRDISERKKLEEELRRRAEQLIEADRRKNDFLAMLAHELRNPLAPIHNGMQILDDLCANDPQVRSVRDMVDRQVGHMTRLIDDLLDVSRITRGKVSLQKQPTELATLIAQAVESTRPLVESRRHRLEVSLPAETLLVQADPTRLTQVFANLLSNAAKYTGEGGHIWLTAHARQGQAVVRVRDTGMGIPAEMLAAVFDLFTQVGDPLERSQGGLGIGLTLVRNLVHLHGGTVEAYSEGVGKGSEFVVRLPLLRVAERSAVSSALSDSGRTFSTASRRLLVVDDNVDAAASLSMMLTLAGHDVSVAHEGGDAIERATNLRPDAVLLDIGLPGMNGYEVARAVRQRLGKGIVLVALTGFGSEEDHRRSLEAGFDYHCVKPATLQALQEIFAALPSVNIGGG